MEKVYLAVVAGQMAEESGEIDLPLTKDWAHRLPPRHRVDHQIGKPALTRWRVIGRELDAQELALELRPLTGRSHQLRVHLAEIGHPILGGPDLPETPWR